MKTRYTIYNNIVITYDDKNFEYPFVVNKDNRFKTAAKAMEYIDSVIEQKNEK